MHIQDKTLIDFTDRENMNTEEMIALLEHLDQCDFCLDQMITEETKNPCASAPDYLTEQILTRASAPDVQAARVIKNTSRKMQLFYYGLRTAAGVIVALFLLFTVQQVDLTSLSFLGTAERPVCARHVQDFQEPKEPVDKLSLFTRNIRRGISEGSDKFLDYIGDIPNKLLK